MLCDKSRALILAADKMIGIGWIEAEPDITKMLDLHKNWKVMFAGEDITPVANVVDRARASLSTDQEPHLQAVIDAMQASYEKQRKDDADDIHLAPRGWGRQDFIDKGKALLPETLYADLEDKLAKYELGIQLIVAGFDPSGLGHIFCMDGDVKRGIPQRCDISGFAAIGAGALGGSYMMYFRKCNPEMKIREAIYYCLEAKWFGEHAGSVGLRTDVSIMRYGKEPIALDDEDTVERTFLAGMCEQLSPRKLLQKRNIRILNSLRELEGSDIEKLELPKKKERKTVVNP
jgi:hypothetical protein